MIRVAYIERQGRKGLGPEQALVQAEMMRRGIPIVLFTPKEIDRRSLPLDLASFVVGGTAIMHGAMKQLGIPIPEPDDYPESLRAFLHRRVWRSTLGRIEALLSEGDMAPVFIKPAERKKAFTGLVVSSPGDLYFIGSSSRRQQIWCSEVVSWLSEYRVYVIHDEVVGVDHYAGDAQVMISATVIAAAIDAFRHSGHAPSGYALDFGVLSTGETALIEANDGYALGAYQIDAANYTNLLLSRWEELLNTRAGAASQGTSAEF